MGAIYLRDTYCALELGKADAEVTWRLRNAQAPMMQPQRRQTAEKTVKLEAGIIKVMLSRRKTAYRSHLVLNVTSSYRFLMDAEYHVLSPLNASSNNQLRL